MGPRVVARVASLVRSKLGDLVLYSKLLPFQFVYAQVVASRMLHFSSNSRLKAFVALTQLPNA